MAPNERGVCSVCVTLDWECVCDASGAKRRRCSFESDSDSQVCYDDVVEDAKARQAEYGVQWHLFRSKAEAIDQAVILVTRASLFAFYVGVARCPAERFYEHNSAHCKVYQKMFVLCVGKKMGVLEKKVIKACRDSRGAACDNKSEGGERANDESIKFLYVCVRTSALDD